MKSSSFINFRKKKYNNCSCTVDGITFHSRREADYYKELKMQKKSKIILDFQRQVSFDLMAWNGQNDDFSDGVKIGRHVVDFLITLPNGEKEVREVKGFETDLWIYKMKIFEANNPDIKYKIIK